MVTRHSVGRRVISNSPVLELIPVQVVQARPTGGRAFVSVKKKEKSS